MLQHCALYRNPLASLKSNSIIFFAVLPSLSLHTFFSVFSKLSMANPVVPWTSPSVSAAMKPAKIGNPLTERGIADDCLLQITIHQANQIHNICSYGNQAVYAKFLLPHRQEAVYTTHPVRDGSQNPVFNQSLEIPLCAWRDAILRCELWTMSCAGDQLLGFVQVPLQNLHSHGRQACEYCLTSTELFYTPAGTVQLSLALLDHSSIPMVPEDVEGSSFCPPYPDSFHCAQQCSRTEANLAGKVEFLCAEAPDEDQHLISMYCSFTAAAAAFEESMESGSSSVLSENADGCERAKGAGHGDPSEKDRQYRSAATEATDLAMAVPLLHFHASSVSSVDDEMLSSPREEDCANNLSYLSASAPSCSEAVPAMVSLREIPISSAGAEYTDNPSPPSPAAMEEKQGTEFSSSIHQANPAAITAGPSLTSAHADPEAPISQEHFVDLYLKSLQQFTDKLADMEFLFNIDAEDIAMLRSVQVDKVADSRKRAKSKLYYGSRAFY